MNKVAVSELGRWIDSVPRGSKRSSSFTVGRHLTGQPVDVPIGVARGEQEGPSLLVVAGIHGDEIAGVAVADEFYRSLRKSDLGGTVIVVPAANPIGLGGRHRYLHDRRDLNRAFPGSDSGSIARRTAGAITTQLLTRAETVVDLHSASNFKYNIPHARVARDDLPSRDLLTTSGLATILEKDSPEGSLRNLAAERDLLSVAIEAGETNRVQRSDVALCLAALVAVTEQLGILPADPDGPGPEPPTILRGSTWVRAQNGGRIKMLVSADEWVEESATLATTNVPLRSETSKIRSPVSGYVLAVTTSALCATGDAIAHLGYQSTTDA